MDLNFSILETIQCFYNIHSILVPRKKATYIFHIRIILDSLWFRTVQILNIVINPISLNSTYKEGPEIVCLLMYVHYGPFKKD